MSVVLDGRGDRLPGIVHWGRDLGEVDDESLTALTLPALGVPVVNSHPDRVSLIPEHAAGWLGVPGLSGHRSGAHWSPLFATRTVELTRAEAGHALTVGAHDLDAQLELTIELLLDLNGLLRVRCAVRNAHPREIYQLDGVLVALPVPSHADELLDLAGRWCRERAPQRRPFHIGSRVRESRRGRTGADASLILAAGQAGFGFRSGDVWGLHVAWSGNHRIYAERLSSGEAVIGAGELLLPGEVRLVPGETYWSPWVFGSFGAGLDEMSERFHGYLRERPTHPTAVRPRPVILNTWEAVYFDHDLARLRRLADAAAEVGVERYVLDDGWFRGRTSDHAGLGDWFVDEHRWPDGLHPLVDYVHAKGMEFGLWVEPEMINPASDLAREHPDWILQTGGRLPPEMRHQQVLDLANPAAYCYLLERLDSLVNEYAIAYLKWDHNRDLVDAGHGSDRAPAVRLQTLSLYRMLDELRRRHPGLEIESCAGGGGRADLGILARTDRIWASDTNDALERQSIQRWTELLLPPELIGAHVGAPRAHTTGRTQDLSFRAGTALFGHLGIEWDLTQASPAERAELAQWVALYKQVRPLLHSGRVVRGDHPDASLWVSGVVSHDRGEALFAVVTMATAVTSPPGRVRLPGLDPDKHYVVRALTPVGAQTSAEIPTPASWPAIGPALAGRVLGEVGVRVPAQFPEHQILLHLAPSRRT